MARGETPSAFTLRTAAVGVALSAVVATYSTYAGLKAGGVYWPIITATLAAMGLLRLGRAPSRQEVNVAATAASTGGLLAAGVLFTVPAAWLAGVPLSVAEVVAIALVGGLLGVAFTVPLREEMIERLALPYPDGTATARVIEAGDEGGRKIKTVLAAAGLAGLFATARDGFRLVPSVVNLETLGLPAARSFSLGSGISLVPLAGGFLIGPKFTGVWFAGAVVSYLVAVPALLAAGRFADKPGAVAGATQPFGIGVIVGASLAYFLLKGLPSFAPMLRRLAGSSRRQMGGLALALAACVAVAALALDLPLWLTVVAVAAAFMVATIAARIAGELNIDPMEIFAIAVLLIVLFFVRLPPKQAVVFAALLAIAAGMAGDFLQDLKAGSLVGTAPADQIKAQVLSVVSSALVVGVVLEALRRAYGIGSVELAGAAGRGPLGDRPGRRDHGPPGLGRRSRGPPHPGLSRPRLGAPADRVRHRALRTDRALPAALPRWPPPRLGRAPGRRGNRPPPGRRRHRRRGPDGRGAGVGVDGGGQIGLAGERGAVPKVRNRERIARLLRASSVWEEGSFAAVLE